VTTIALIVTGDLEREGMKASLEAVFPDVDFRVEQVSPITSSPLSLLPQERVLKKDNPAWRLVDRLWRSVTKLRSPDDITAADYAMAIDDIELCNLRPHGDPSHITALVRTVAQRFLDDRYPDPTEREFGAQALREKCSFHLLSPMIEAYFFGEQAALHRAGVPEGRPVLRKAGDLEDFQAEDPAYAAPSSVLWQQQRAKRLGGGLRLDPDRHPKDYLSFLRDAHTPSPREKVRGADALKPLAWPGLTTNPAELPFLRALFEDIAEALGTSSPLGDGTASPLTWPVRNVDRSTLTLRNL
jgi:hypothetical protein